MNTQISFDREKEDLLLWARDVGKKCKAEVKPIRYTVAFGKLVQMEFLVDGLNEIAPEMNSIIVDQGRKYTKGRRYFHIFDSSQKKAFMILQFYPYYLFQDDGVNRDEIFNLKYDISSVEFLGNGNQ